MDTGDATDDGVSCLDRLSLIVTGLTSTPGAVQPRTLLPPCTKPGVVGPSPVPTVPSRAADQ